MLAASRWQAVVAAPAPLVPAAAPSYARHAPERTLLYALVQAHYPDFIARVEAEDRPLPEYVREEFDAYLRCGVLEHGFLRVVCEQCHAERLLPFSCKKRGFCPSCGARRMAESARHLVETVFGPLSGIGEKWLWIRAQTGACVAPAYPTDWPKRTFEFPILPQQLFLLRDDARHLDQRLLGISRPRCRLSVVPADQDAGDLRRTQRTTLGHLPLPLALAASSGMDRRTQHLDSRHAFCPPRDYTGRRYRPLQGQLRQSSFFWDVLFGTAKITRNYPARVGLKDDAEHGPERWWVQLLYPIVKSKREQSALAREAKIVG